jgi:hypothetical protein
MTIIIIITFLLTATVAQAQEWSKSDSLKLNELLKGEEEIKLNLGMPMQIDFGLMSTQRQPEEKNWLQADETLPSAISGQEKLDMKAALTLHPYKPGTPYNYDPVRGRKFKVDKDTWRSEPYYALTSLRTYSNWAKRWTDAGLRNSVEQIEATGLRYNPLSQGADGRMSGGWEYCSGPSGHDFSAPFTKEFWNRKARLRRLRTLEVLAQYGDSTTVALNVPIINAAKKQ